MEVNNLNDIILMTQEEEKLLNDTIERFLKLGISGKNRIIIEMAKEIDMYREKLRDYEMPMKMDKAVKDLDEALAEVAWGHFSSGVLMVKEEGAQVHVPIIDALPDDLRDRLASVTVDSDERISLYFLEAKNGNDKQ